MTHAPVRARTGFAALVAFAAWAAGGAAQAAPGSLEPWFELHTRNFVLLSSSDERTARRVGDWLETLRAVLPNITTNVDLDLPQPPVVYLFRNPSSFDRYKNENSIAVSVFQGDHRFVAVNALTYGAWGGEDSPPLRDLYHEYTHLLIRNNFSNPPLWANEGLAEYYSTFRRKGRRGDIGRPITSHVALLREERWYPLATLIALDEKAGDPRLRRIFYAQSWALVHYLVSSGPELAGRFHRYLLLTDQGMRSKEAFEAVFGSDLSELELAVQDYVSWNRFRYARVKVPRLPPDERAAPRPLPQEEILTRLAVLQSCTRPDEAATIEARFRRALELRPDYPPALVGLGEFLLRQGRRDEAEAPLRRAVAVDPGGASGWYLLGNAVLNRFVREGGVPPEGASVPAAVAEARHHFRASFKIDPMHGDALGAFGATYAFQPADHAEGIAALRTAATLLPSRMDFIYNLLVLHLLDGDQAGARKRAAEGLRRAPEALVGSVRAAADSLSDPGLPGARARRDDIAAVAGVIDAELDAALADESRRARIREALGQFRPPADAASERGSAPGGR